MRAFNSLDCARDYSTYGFHSGDVRNLQHLRISDAGPYDFTAVVLVYMQLTEK